MAKRLITIIIVSLFLVIPSQVNAQQSVNVEVVNQDWYVTNNGDWNLQFSTDGINQASAADITIFAIEDGGRVPLHRFNEIEFNPSLSQHDWELNIRSLSSEENERTLIPATGRYIVGIDIRNQDSVLASTETVMNVTANDFVPEPTLVLLVGEDELASALDLIESTEAKVIVGFEAAAVNQLINNEQLLTAAVPALAESTTFSFISTSADISSIQISELLDEVAQLVGDSNRLLEAAGLTTNPSLTLFRTEPNEPTLESLAELGFNSILVSDGLQNDGYRFANNPEVALYQAGNTSEPLPDSISATSQAAATLSPTDQLIVLDTATPEGFAIAERLAVDFKRSILPEPASLELGLPTSIETPNLFENSDAIAAAFQLALSYQSQGPDTAVKH